MPRLYSPYLYHASGPILLWSRDFTAASLGANATCTSTGTRTVTDFEALTWTELNNIARFTGARRVENLDSNPTFNDDGPGEWYPSTWTHSTAVGTYASSCADNEWTVTCNTGRQFAQKSLGALTTGNRFVMSAEVIAASYTAYDSTTCQVYNIGTHHDQLYTSEAVNAIGGRALLCDVEATSSATRTMTMGIGLSTSAVAVASWTMTNFMREKVDAKANKNPSEFTETVAYYPYQNGNTVSAGVITQAQGSALTDITLKFGAGDTISWSDVPSGSSFIRFTFDDDSTTDVSVSDWDGVLDSGFSAQYGEIKLLEVYG